MKTKNGKVKLEKGEIRVDNFFFKREAEHIKVQDINTTVSFRISRRVAVGMWLDAMIDQGKEGEPSLGLYAAMTFAMLLTVPDDEYVNDVFGANDRAVKRHPDFYGVRTGEVSDEDDAQIVEEEREKAEFVEEMKQMSEGKDGDD